MAETMAEAMPESMAGVYFAIGAAIVFSLGHVAIRRAVGVLGVVNGIAVMLVSAMVLITLSALLLEDATVLWQATRAGMLYFVAAGLVHFIAGWGFMNASTRLIGAARMSAITGITPFFAAMLAILTLHEALNLYIGLGILAIMAGTYFIATN
jgi:drug/metabolite transporter (DMT)-like permease